MTITSPDAAAPRVEWAQLLGRSLPRIQIVDIGAMTVGDDRYQPLVAADVAEVVGFEPNPAEYARLTQRKGPYRYIQTFVGNGSPMTFHLAGFPGCSSLLAPNSALIDLFTTIGSRPGDNFSVRGKMQVDTTRLDELGPDVVPDFVKLDVQGYELEIMRHGVAKIASATVIECEVEFVPLYEQQPLFGDVQCFLRDQGFMLHKLIDVTGRPFRPFAPPNPHLPISQLLWADAIFVRDFTRLDRYSDDELIKASLVLDLVYGSYDLVALLLGEYDRRTGKQVQRVYIEANAQRPSASLNIMDRAQ